MGGYEFDTCRADKGVQWHQRFLDLAKHVSQWSKDPSTKCGAVIVDGSRRVVSLGYNGFATGVRDDESRYHDREMKYRLVQHAELNAILFASRPLAGCTLYTYPFGTCERCAVSVIQSGITTVISPRLHHPRWIESHRMAAIQYRESGVQWIVIEGGNLLDGLQVYAPPPIPGQGRCDL